MTNLFDNQKKSLKRSGKNPERINQLTQIIQPKLKVFIGVSVGCVSALLGWSIIGNIPITVTGKATFVEPESLIEVRAETDGILVFTSDLRESARKELYNLTQVIEYEMEELKTNEKNIDKYTSRLDNVILAANNYIRITLMAQSLDKNLFRTLARNNSGSPGNYTGDIERFPGEPIAYILNADKASSFLENLSRYRLSLTKLRREKRNYNLLAGKANKILDEQKRQVAIVEELYKKGILPETSLISSEKQLLADEKEILDDQFKLNEHIVDIREKGATITSTLYKSAQKVEVLVPEKSKIISRLAETGQGIKQNQTIAVVTTGNVKTNPMVITGVFPMKSVQGIERGLSVLVDPENAERNSYGSVKGEIQTISNVPIDKSNAVFKVGSEARATSLYEGNQTMSLASIKLKSNDKGKYEWTSSNGPAYPIPIGTQADLTVITGNKKPISILLPFIRKVTGQ